MSTKQAKQVPNTITIVSQHRTLIIPVLLRSVHTTPYRVSRPLPLSTWYPLLVSNQFYNPSHPTKLQLQGGIIFVLTGAHPSPNPLTMCQTCSPLNSWDNPQVPSKLADDSGAESKSAVGTAGIGYHSIAFCAENTISRVYQTSPRAIGRTSRFPGG